MPLSRSFFNEWKERNLPVVGGCRLKGRVFFFNLRDVIAYFMPIKIVILI